MAFTGTNDYITGRAAAPYPAGRENVTVRYTLAFATADLALNTIGQFGWLPAGCVPVDVRVIADDVDSSSAALVIGVGIWDGSGANLSTDAADGGGAWGDTGSAVNTAFDKALTRTLNNMSKVTKSDSDRRLGAKVTTAPTTAVAGNVTIELTYRAA